MAAKGLVHLNGHLLCAVDTETTGLVAGHHDIIQVAIVPLNSELLPNSDIQPFYIDIIPVRPENAEKSAMLVNKMNLADVMRHGMEKFKAADLLEEWFEKLELPFRKKIAPLGANYSFDKSFLLEWLGPQTYDHIFDYHVRDIQSVASFLNDRAAFHAEAAPFPKVNVAYLASQLEIPHEKAHDALQDCLVEAEIYRRMVKKYFS